MNGLASTLHLMLHDWALDFWYSLPFCRNRLNMDLIKTLNNLGQRINRYYPLINEGGCCVYASLVGKELQNRGIAVKIVVAARDARGNLDVVRRKLNNNNLKSEWNEKNVWFNHVGFEFKYKNRIYHADTNGVNPKGRKLQEWRIYSGRLSLDEGTILANEPEGWNDSFDRNKIPSLKRHIKSYLASKLPQ